MNFKSFKFHQQTTIEAHERQVVVKKFKKHHLPFIDLIGHYYPLTKAIVLSLIILAIGLPIIIKNNYHWLTFLTLSPLILVLIFCIFEMSEFVFCKSKYNAWKISEGKTPNASEVNAGAPGTGKTMEAIFATHARAEYSWKQIQYKFWKVMNKLKNPLYNPTEKEKEIIEAYEFYISNEGMPCAGANFPVYSKIYKCYFYDVNADHLKQKYRLPYGMNDIFDEAGTTTAPSDLCHDKNNERNSVEITESAKYSRHHGEFKHIFCEQDFNNIYINVRRVVSENRVFEGKKLLLYPRILDAIFEWLKERFTKHMSMKESKWFSKFMDNYETFLKACGFWKYTYKTKANVQTSGSDNKVVIVEKEEKGNSIYLPKAMPFTYLTRAFIGTYKCLYDKISVKPFVNIRFSREQALSMIKAKH